MTQTTEQRDAITGAFMQAAERTPITLYQISAEWTDVLDRREDGVLTDEQAQDQLRALAVDFRHVALGAGFVIRNTESQADQCQLEIDRLTARKKHLEARSAWLRGYVLEQMQRIGIDKIEGGIFTLSIRQNPVSVQVDDASLVPGEYQRTTITMSVDKVAIRKHSEATGEVIPGTRLVRTERLELR